MTLPNLPYGTPLDGASAGLWAAAICEQLKAPTTEANVYSFAGWFLREGGGGQNNPMNTTLGSQYPAINSDGVRDFPTPEIGVQYTVATLEDGYPNVVASFRAGVGLEHPNTATAAELSKWSGGGYTFITPVVVPMPTPDPPKEEIMAVAAAVGNDGKVHVFQETSDGTVYGSTQQKAGGPYSTPFVVMKNGKQVKG